ncbi:hypothetical protein BH10PSE13_BH10PSE13_11960 [soil metagenome]
MTTDFATQGYAALPLFDPTTVRAAQGDIAEHIDRLSHALYWPYAKSSPGAPLGERLDRICAEERSQAALLRTAICTDAHRGPRLSALATAPELRAVGEHLCSKPIGDIIVRIRANIPAFPEHRHAWHSDVAIDDGTDCGRVAVTAWIPLRDTGPNQGGIEILPGRRSAPLPHRLDRGYSIDEGAIDEEALAGLTPVQPSCPAGTVLFLDRFTPHRTLPAGPSARFALVVWMKAA